MLDGLLLVDKPQGLTSHDVVAKIRKILSIKAVGHTGTLDPMASGLMVMLIGEATKLSDYLLKGDKGYALKTRLGVTTDSLDITGEVLKEVPVDCSKIEIENAVKSLTGEFELPIPMFSAKKINGKKLYELARAGEEIEVPRKVMKFYNLEGLQIEPTEVSLQMRCSKGSFIRSWASQLGEDLGVGATLSSLRRVFSAPYELSHAITLEHLKELWPADAKEQTVVEIRQLLGKAFVPLAEALPEIPGLTVMGHDQKLLRNGQVSFALSKRLISHQKWANKWDQVVRIKVHSGNSGQLMALLEVRPCNSLKIKRVFNCK